MLGQQPSAPPAAVLQAHDERWEALVGEFWGTDSGEALSAVLRRMEEYVLQSAPAVDLSAEILQMAGQKRALDEAAWKHASAAFGGLMRAAGRTPPPTAAMATRPTPGIGPVMATPIDEPALVTSAPAVVVGSVLGVKGWFGCAGFLFEAAFVGFHPSSLDPTPCR